MDVFSFEQACKKYGLNSRLSRILLSWAFHFFKINDFNKGYNKLKHLHGIQFIDAALDYLNLKISYNKDGISFIPESGPFILIANHPHGILDGLILLKIITNIRPDVKVLSNDLIQNLAPLRQYFIPLKVDHSGKPVFMNAKRILKASQEGVPLIYFPAASVSHFQFNKFRVEDKPWDKTAMKFIQKADVPVIPVFIEGRNSWLYQVLYNLAIKLSLVCLVREFMNMKNKKIVVRISKPVRYENLTLNQLSSQLRKSVYRLKTQK